jgi:hypothetical protein
MIWLQVDCNADADDRGERFPDPPEGVSWNPESVQGLEVEYVRADLVRAAMPVNATDDGDPELKRLAEVLGMTANALIKPRREAASA